MTSQVLEPVATMFGPLAGADLVQLFADEDIVDTMREQAATLLEPDAEVVFVAADGVVLPGQDRGFDGLMAGWREWVSAFTSYRFEIEDLLQEGERVITLVRQTGRTRHGGVDVPSSPSAAICTVRDGRVARMAFYLDREHAARVEGFELPGS